MKEIAISKFKATCLAVLEDVRRTGTPVRVTRFGRPIADILPARPTKASDWLGRMRGSFDVEGDLVGPVGAFRNWTAEQK